MKQKSFFRFRKLAALLALVALVAAGCGSKSTGSSGQVTIKIWKTFEDSDNLQALFDAYQQKHPNVQIVYTKKNVDNYEANLVDALASGSGPDIFSIHNDWLPRYLDKIAPAPDKTFLFKDYKDAFIDTVVQDFTKDNKVYGTAMAVDSLGLYYNKDIIGSAGIAVPPKTWDELSAQVQRLKKSDGKGYFTRSGVAMGTSSNVNRAVDILYLLMLQKRAVPFNADGTEPMFNQDLSVNGNRINPGQAALDFYTSFANPVSLNYNWNARSDYSIDAFANGRAAYLYSYSYTRQSLLQKNPNLNFDVAPVPQPDLDNPAVNFSNYWGEVVSKQSKNQAVAWDLLKFLTSKDSLDKYYAKNKQPSSRKDLIQVQINDPEIGVFAHANLTAKSFYKPSQTKIDDIFAKAIDNVILNGVSINDALNQAEQQASVVAQSYQ